MPNKPLFFLYLILGCCLLASSCSYKQNQVLFTGNTARIDSANKQAFINAGKTVYRIQPQDILQIRNLQNIAFLSGEVTTQQPSVGDKSINSTEVTPSSFQVDDDGTVALPVIGHVKIAGLTRPEAAKLIEELYRKNLLKDPIIEVKIVNLKVTLFGEVTRQGNYLLSKDRTTLTDILGEAGGLTEKADETTVKIIRGTGPQQQVAYLNLRDINSLSSPDIVLHNNDIIYIAQNKRAVRTDKFQNLSTLLQPALILLNTALIIYTIAHR